MERYIAPGVEQTPEYYGTLQAMPNPYFIPAWVVHTFTLSCGAPVWIGHAGNKRVEQTYTLTPDEVNEMIRCGGDTIVLTRIVRAGLDRRERAYKAVFAAKRVWDETSLTPTEDGAAWLRYMDLLDSYEAEFTSQQYRRNVIGERGAHR